MTPESVQQTSDDLVTAIDDLESADAATDVSGLLDQPATDAGTLSDAASSLDGTATNVAGAAQTLSEDTADRAGDARTLQDGAATIQEDVTALDTSVQDTATSTGTAADSAATYHRATVESYTRTRSTTSPHAARNPGPTSAFCEDLTGVVGRPRRAPGTTPAGRRRIASTADEAAGTAAQQTTDFADTAAGMTDAADSHRHLHR